MLDKWIYAAVGSAVLCTICLSLTADAKSENIIKFVCALVMASAVVSPIMNISFEEYALSLEKYKQKAQEITDDTDGYTSELNRRIIEEKYSAYIFDKAKLSGIEPIEVKVAVNWYSEGYWYPVGTEIVLSDDDLDKDRTEIIAIIETDLGIPSENQTWRT